MEASGREETCRTRRCRKTRKEEGDEDKEDEDEEHECCQTHFERIVCPCCEEKRLSAQESACLYGTIMRLRQAGDELLLLEVPDVDGAGGAAGGEDGGEVCAEGEVVHRPICLLQLHQRLVELDVPQQNPPVR